MSKIISIAVGTYHPGLNNINDVVETFGDDVELGPAYDSFRVVNMPGITKKELDGLLPIGDPSMRISKYANKLPLTKAQIKILEKMPADKVTKKNLILLLVVRND